ncbi:hypothetical protein ABTX79_37700, partial [Streptomyces sp. NPDC096153]
ATETRRFFHRRQRQPHVVTGYFKAPHVRYILSATSSTSEPKAFRINRNGTGKVTSPKDSLRPRSRRTCGCPGSPWRR